MIRFYLTIAMLAFAAALSEPVLAEDAKPLTVLQCISVLSGLNALSCSGAQLNGPACAADAKQYKLGPLRVTIGLNIGRLQEEANAIQRAQNDFITKEAPAADPKDAAAQAERAKKIQDNWNAIIDASCPIKLGHLSQAALDIGDAPDHNAFPPSVIGALMSIIDP